MWYDEIVPVHKSILYYPVGSPTCDVNDAEPRISFLEKKTSPNRESSQTIPSQVETLGN